MLCKIIKLLLLGGWGGETIIWAYSNTFPIIIPQKQNKTKKAWGKIQIGIVCLKQTQQTDLFTPLFIVNVWKPTSATIHGFEQRKLHWKLHMHKS